MGLPDSPRFSDATVTSPPDGFWSAIISATNPEMRRRVFYAVIALVLGIGLVDYVTGFEISLQVFYFLPVALAVTGLGWRSGVATAVASVVVWIASDFASGALYSSPWVTGWNVLIRLGTYLVLVWLLASMVALQREVEERVRQRTAALTEEIAERKRLEKAILDISERERRNIGRDLHDDLGQHLTGTALAGQVLGEKLQARMAEEEPDAWRIVALLEQGIEKTRRMAKGLLLAEVEPDGLRAALQELAATTMEHYRIQCEFHCETGANLTESSAATHLFRIAQEAVRNAFNHGKARQVRIALQQADGRLTLTVRDDGRGLPAPGARGEGLGLRIMAHRAALINARFTIEAHAGGGTLVTCQFLPATSPLHDRA